MEASLSDAGGWTTFAFILLFLFAFSVTFTRYYQDRQEAEYLATAVTVLGLFFCLVTVAIVPVDIYFVSSTMDPVTGLKHIWATPEVVEQLFATVKGTYYAFYSGVAILSFVIIPFAYFYFEEYEEGQPTRERVIAALHYTIYTVVIIAILLIVGFFLNPNENDKMNLGWFKKLLTASGGERSLTFLIAVMTLVGMLIYISYTAYGLSIFPILMIKGTRVTASDDLDVQSCLATNREKQNAITSKYLNTTATILKKDQKVLKELEKEERILLRRATAITRKRKGWLNRFLAVLRPFEFVFGVGFLILSGLIFVSILLTSIDKISNNICGSQCGYLLSHPLIFNPINHVFLKLAKFFPLDYLFFVLVIIYFFACTMAGIVNIGIRFLWVTMFKIRRGSTPPQALLFATVILMLSLLALNYTVTSLIAPQYAQFGTQKYCNFTSESMERNCTGHEDYIIPCDISAPTDLCTPTALSDLINRITVSTPFFGAAYFYAQWLFMIVVVLGFLWATFRPKQTDVEEEELEDDERALLAERQRHGGTSRAAV